MSYLLIIVNYNGLEDKYLYKKFVSTTLFCKFAMKRDLKKRKLKEFYFNTENTEDSEKKNESLYLSKEIFVYSVFSVFQKSCFHLYLEKMMRNKIFLNFTFGEKSSKFSPPQKTFRNFSGGRPLWGMGGFILSR